MGNFVRSNLNTIQNVSTISSLVAEFPRQFQLVIATTPELREEVYKIRYRVYCQELEYEPKNNYPEGMEQDAFDRRSIHCLLQHQRSRLYAGCVRLVLPTPYSAEERLPFEKIFGDSWRSRQRELKNLSSQAIGEVSRLAITAEFRRYQEALQEQFSEEEKRFFPLIPLGLYLGATNIALERELNSVFALMEPRLVRHLNRFGIWFQQVGDFVEFHGRRGLYQVSREAVLKDMSPMSFVLLKSIQVQVKEQLLYYDPHCYAA